MYLTMYENLLAEIVDGFDDIVWALSLPSLTPTFFNNASLRLYQCSHTELIENPQRWLQAIALEDRPKMQQAIAEVQLQGSAKINYRILLPDGKTRWFSSRLKMSKNDLGEPIRIDAIASEIPNTRASNQIERSHPLRELVELKTEDIVSSNDSRYLSMVQHHNDLIMRSLPDFTISFANEALCSMYGNTVEQIIGTNWLDFTNPEEVRDILDKIALMTPENPSFIAVNRDYRTDGQFSWTQWLNQGIFDDNGQLVEIQSVGRDITTLKLTEQALTELNEELEQRIEQRTRELIRSEARNRTVLETIPDLLLLLKPDGTCLDQFMPATSERDKYIPIQKHIEEVLAPEVLQIQLNLHQQAIATGKAHIYEHQITKFGKTNYEEVRIAPYFEDELLVIVRDITDRKLVEEQLIKSDTHLKTAQRVGKIGSWEFELSTGNVVWSEEVFRIFGRDPNIGTPCYAELQDYVHPEDWERFDQTVQIAISTGQFYEIEYRVCWQDGTIVDVYARGEIVSDLAGNPTHIFGIVMDISERKKTEQQLRTLTDRLTVALKAASIGIWEWDVVNNRLFWDDRNYQLYGVEPEYPIDAYSSWVERLHPSDRDFTEEAMRLALSGEKEYEPEFRIVLPDGSIRHLKAYALVQRNENNEPQRMIGVNFDITNRKLAEARLLKSESHLRSAQRIGKIGSWECEISTGKIKWSEEVFRLYGIDPSCSEPNYEQLRQYIHPDDWEMFNQTVQKAVSLCQSYELEHRLFRSNGDLVYVLARGEMVFNESGEITQIIGTAMDITDRKLAEAELNRSRELREAIFNESTDALFLVDAHTLLTIDCNNYAVQLFEASDKSQLIGIEGHTLQRSRFSDQELANIDAELKTKGFWSLEVEYVSLRGRAFWGNLAVKPITLLDKKINLVRVTDISDRKLNEAKIIQTAHQLELTNRELESFSYSVSHDLRAPLRHMNGFVNALQQQLKGHEAINDPKVIHYLQVVHNSSQKMGHLIDGLLTLSRYGRRPLEAKPISVRQLVENAIEIICADASYSSQVDFVIGDLPEVVGDPTLIQQVFCNLIANAIKFSRNHPQPRIEIDSLPDQTIRVNDNGVGFQMEYADKLFGAFQRLHSEKEFEGTGIGLAIVQRIIQRHNGEIWAESQPNHGATFFIKLAIKS
ncbi:MAG: hypothetical protein DCE90_08830 [Pseudanabaena sp.]|nr:MAG: hypothetical protein DCE90_08830 [Pseudanabaena sp.]